MMKGTRNPNINGRQRITGKGRKGSSISPSGETEDEQEPGSKAESEAEQETRSKVESEDEQEPGSSVESEDEQELGSSVE